MKKVKEKVLKAICMIQSFFFGLALSAADVLAKNDMANITKGINTLKSLVMTAIGGVGVIFLAWGLLDFGSAYSAHDTSQQMQGIKKVIGGLIIVAIPTLINVLT